MLSTVSRRHRGIQGNAERETFYATAIGDSMKLIIVSDETIEWDVEQNIENVNLDRPTERMRILDQIMATIAHIEGPVVDGHE